MFDTTYAATKHVNKCADDVRQIAKTYVAADENEGVATKRHPRARRCVFCRSKLTQWACEDLSRTIPFDYVHVVYVSQRIARSIHRATRV